MCHVVSLWSAPFGWGLLFKFGHIHMNQSHIKFSYLFPKQWINREMFLNYIGLNDAIRWWAVVASSSMTWPTIIYGFYCRLHSKIHFGYHKKKKRWTHCIDWGYFKSLKEKNINCVLNNNISINNKKMWIRFLWGKIVLPGEIRLGTVYEMSSFIAILRFWFIISADCNLIPSTEVSKCIENTKNMVQMVKTVEQFIVLVLRSKIKIVELYWWKN